MGPGREGDGSAAPGRRATGRVLEAVARGVAAGQHGLATRPQLLDAGLTPRVIGRLIEQGWLKPVHRGVYLVGPIARPHSREMAAVLACGRHAWVSHGSAAGLWEVRPTAAASEPVDVTVRGRTAGQRPGIRAYRVAQLDPAERTELNGIPVTTPGRTLLDLAWMLGRRGMVRELEQAVARAERSQLIDGVGLRKVVDRHPGRRGVALLRAIVQEGAEPAFTRSEAEELLLAVIQSARLPMPLVNATVLGYEVDFHWPTFRLVVEVDGFAYHSAQRRFEGDRRRDSALTSAGWRVLRITWNRIVRERDVVLGQIARAMGPERLP